MGGSRGHYKHTTTDQSNEDVEKIMKDVSAIGDVKRFNSSMIILQMFLHIETHRKISFEE